MTTSHASEKRLVASSCSGIPSQAMNGHEVPQRISTEKPDVEKFQHDLSIWAIGDLHLAQGTPNKAMSLLLPSWHEYQERIKEAWDTTVKEGDIVLLPGDISWAMRLEEALPDIDFLAKRPGIKVLIRGNHDYWWDTASKVRKALPKDMYIIHNDSVTIGSIAIAGARLWESSEYSFSSIIDFKENLKAKQKELNSDEENEKIFRRELLRLESSLQLLPKNAPIKIAMTHFPPIGLDLAPSQTSSLLESYGVQYCIFGHLHSLKPSLKELFGMARGVEYILTSADWLNFAPKLVKKIQSK